MPAKIETSLIVESNAFCQGEYIPKRYSCEGENINPPIKVSGYPENTKTIAIIVEDPDAPRGVFDHWLVWNIPANEQPIAENSILGVTGRNSFGKMGYDGPCPPTGSHRYFFKVYALDAELHLLPGSDKKTLESAMQNHILDSGKLMGFFKKGKE